MGSLRWLLRDEGRETGPLRGTHNHGLHREVILASRILVLQELPGKWDAGEERLVDVLDALVLRGRTRRGRGSCGRPERERPRNRMAPQTQLR